jgi:hypothetical protein
MIYRPNRTYDQTPTILEQYGESNILSLFRFYLPMREPLNLPNFDFGPTIEAATKICEKTVSSCYTSFLNLTLPLLSSVKGLVRHQ